MGDYSLFQMCARQRMKIINKHDFYIEQAQIKIFSQFINIEAEVDKFYKQWYEIKGRHSNDPDAAYEQAIEIRYEHYDLLTEMQRTTILSITAGMFHAWDKKLREWLANECNHWCREKNTSDAIWKVTFDDIMGLMKAIGSKESQNDYLETLNQLRWIVNAYKHGAGKSFDEIHNNHPQFLAKGYGDTEGELAKASYLDHTYLCVTEQQVTDFSEAIKSFWINIPDNVTAPKIGELPKWFIDVTTKDGCTYIDT